MGGQILYNKLVNAMSWKDKARNLGNFNSWPLTNCRLAIGRIAHKLFDALAIAVSVAVYDSAGVDSEGCAHHVIDVFPGLNAAVVNDLGVLNAHVISDSDKLDNQITATVVSGFVTFWPFNADL